MKPIFMASLFAAAAVSAQFAGATPGKTDAQGCHDSRKIGHHCHPERATGGSGETTAQRDKRMARECKGRPNAGACLGFTR